MQGSVGEEKTGRNSGRVWGLEPVPVRKQKKQGAAAGKDLTVCEGVLWAEVRYSGWGGNAKSGRHHWIPDLQGQKYGAHPGSSLDLLNGSCRRTFRNDHGCATDAKRKF